MKEKDCVKINIGTVLTWLTICSIACSALYYLLSSHVGIYKMESDTQDNTKKIERIEQTVERIAEKVNRIDGKMDVLLINKKTSDNQSLVLK